MSNQGVKGSARTILCEKKPNVPQVSCELFLVTDPRHLDLGVLDDLPHPPALFPPRLVIRRPRSRVRKEVKCLLSPAGGVGHVGLHPKVSSRESGVVERRPEQAVVERRVVIE
jgi:hypothetical protein